MVGIMAAAEDSASHVWSEVCILRLVRFQLGLCVSLVLVPPILDSVTSELVLFLLLFSRENIQPKPSILTNDTKCARTFSLSTSTSRSDLFPETKNNKPAVPGPRRRNDEENRRKRALPQGAVEGKKKRVELYKERTTHSRPALSPLLP